MSAAAGWYADPSGATAQLRWWDGARWTDHVTPDPAAATSAAGDRADTLVTSTTPAAPSQPPPPQGPPLREDGWGSGAAPAWGAGTPASPTPSWQTAAPPTTSGSSVRTGLIVAAIVGVAVLVVIVALLTGLLGASSSWTRATAAGGSLSVGQSITGRIEPDGVYEATVTVDRAGTVRFDVRGQDDLDAVLEVLDEAGTVVARNDDRGPDADTTDGRYLDPLLDVDLAPGTYTARIDGFAGDAGTFELHVG